MYDPDKDPEFNSLASRITAVERALQSTEKEQETDKNSLSDRKSGHHRDCTKTTKKGTDTSVISARSKLNTLCYDESFPVEEIGTILQNSDKTMSDLKGCSCSKCPTALLEHLIEILYRHLTWSKDENNK